jgi:pilus assembly protein CpaD
MNTTQTKSLGILTLTGLLTLLAACAAGPKGWSESNVEKRNKVELVRLTQDIDFNTAGADATLPEAAANAVDNFLKVNAISHNDELSLDLPQAKSREETKDNLKHRRALSAYLAARGLSLAAAATPYGAEPLPGTARLVVGRYVVTPPACPDWSKPAGADYQNTASSNHGCAVESALGRMVANPHDLIEGRDLSPASGATGAKAIQTYNEAPLATPAGASSQGASASGGAASGSATTGN